MIVIRIGKKKYKGVYRWDDITLGKFCDLAAIPMPEGYESYIIADGMASEETIDDYVKVVFALTDKQIDEDFPAYYRRVITCLSDIPEEMLTPELTNDLFQNYFRPFVVSLVYRAPVIQFMGKLKDYVPHDIGVIRLGHHFFYAPKTVTVLDQEITLANEPSISYFEATDVLGEAKISRETLKRLALFMSIYCRKRGELYDEKKALSREPLFMNAKMSDVWSVFFYTIRRIGTLDSAIRLYGSLPRSLREIVSRVKTLASLEAVS